jgi:hypothetical protein
MIKVYLSKKFSRELMYRIFNNKGLDIVFGEISELSIDELAKASFHDIPQMYLDTGDKIHYFTNSEKDVIAFQTFIKELKGG